MTLESIRKQAESRETEERRKYDQVMFVVICGGAVVTCALVLTGLYLMFK